MNEARYTYSMNKKLPIVIRVWKICAAYVAGVPDCRYSGYKATLWIEWKYIHKLPKKHKPRCSPLQIDWLREEYERGRNVAVMVGSPEGIALYRNLDWETQQPTAPRLLTKDQALDWIHSQVQAGKRSDYD